MAPPPPGEQSAVLQVRGSQVLLEESKLMYWAAWPPRLVQYGPASPAGSGLGIPSPAHPCHRHGTPARHSRTLPAVDACKGVQAVGMKHQSACQSALTEPRVVFKYGKLELTVFP